MPAPAPLASPVAPTPFLSVTGVEEATRQPTAIPAAAGIADNEIRIEQMRVAYSVKIGGEALCRMQATNDGEHAASFSLLITTSAEGWRAALAAGGEVRVITLMPGETIVFDVFVRAAPHSTVDTVNETRVTAVLVDRAGR